MVSNRNAFENETAAIAVESKHETAVIAPDFTSDQLVGHWRARQGAYTCDWLLRSDGSFSADVAEHGFTISHQIGTWSIEDAELVSICTEDEFDLVAPGHIERDVLVEVFADYFILKTKQGIRRKYERV